MTLFKKFLNYSKIISLLTLFLSACTQNYDVIKNQSGITPTDIPTSKELRLWTQNINVSPENRVIDIIFVVDNSSSMELEQNILETSFKDFITNFKDSNFDFRIGVLSTDTRPATISSPGSASITAPLGTAPWTFSNYANFSNMGPGSLLSFQSNERVLTNTSENLIEQFTQNVKLGNEGYGSEMGIFSLITAFSPELSGEGKWNSNFLRKEALLSMIIVSDEDETLAIGTQTYLASNPAAKNERFESFHNSAMQIKNSRLGLLRVDAVVRPEKGECKTGAAVGLAYAELASKYNGRVINVCSDFSADLNQLGSEIVVQVQSQFALDKTPVTELVLKLNGLPLLENTDYTYVANNNSIELLGPALEVIKKGPSQLSISYKY